MILQCNDYDKVSILDFSNSDPGQFLGLILGPKFDIGDLFRNCNSVICDTTFQTS